MWKKRRDANSLLILIGGIATVRVIIARNATVQMEEADCRWDSNSMAWVGQTDQLIDSSESMLQAPGPDD